MKRYSLAIMGALALIAVVVAGCGDDDKSSDSSENQKAAKVAMLVPAYSDYQQAQEEGLKKVLEPAGGSVKVFNSEFDAAMLTTQCNDVINSGRYNAIVLNAPEAPVGVPCATAAAKAGIPVIGNVITIGKDPNATAPQVDGVVGGVYNTPENNARIVVETVKRGCEGVEPPCKVIAEQGTASDAFTNTALKALENTEGVEIVQKFVSFYDPATVSKSAPDVLSANRDADVYLAVADNTAIVAAQLIKEAGLADTMKVLGSGASRAGVQAVKDGTLFITSGDWPIQQGEILAGMAIKAVNGETIDPNAVASNTLDEPEFVTKDNADQMQAEWGAQ